MAKLLKGEYPTFPRIEHYNGDWEKWYEESDKMLEEIKKIGRLYSYPVADGRAFYFIVSFSPLILHHIPYIDNWSLPDAHIRGLQLSDIRAYQESEKLFEQLFGEE